jgi:hypothetical protein
MSVTFYFILFVASLLSPRRGLPKRYECRTRLLNDELRITMEDLWSDCVFLVRDEASIAFQTTPKPQNPVSQNPKFK